MMKKLISVILSAVMLLTLSAGIDFSALAAGNSISTATSISLGTTYSGSITNSNTKDVWKFTLPSSGKITLKATAYIEYVNYYVYDSDGSTLWESEFTYWNSNTEQSTVTTALDFTSGTYYFAVSQDYRERTGNYSFSVGFASANESFQETKGGTNNSMLAASSVSLDTTYKGQIAENDSKDLYKFTLSSSGKITLKATAYIEYVNYYVYDSDGSTLWESEFTYWNSTTGKSTVNETMTLEKGTYYFAVSQDYRERTGNYSFSINRVITVSSPGSFQVSTRKATSIKLSWGKVSGATGYQLQKKPSGGSYTTVQTGSATSCTVSSLSAGTSYSFRVRAYKTVNGKKYYSSYITLTTATKPKKATINSVQSKKSKQLTVKWKSLSASGYQIQIATDSKFTKNKKTVTVKGSGTSKTFSGLKSKKKYYVRIRAYKKVNGTKYYGSWSDVKTATTKK